jgi:hypothetical protein
VVLSHGLEFKNPIRRSTSTGDFDTPLRC